MPDGSMERVRKPQFARVDEHLGEPSKADGYSDEYGLNKCPECGTLYTANGGLDGGVVAFCRETDANPYMAPIHDTDPDDGPFVCEGCWGDAVAATDREIHNTLDDIANND